MKKNNNEKKYSGIFIACLVIIAFIGGNFCGMILQQQLIYLGLAEVAKGMEGNTFNFEIDINETLMVDRFTNNMIPILESMEINNNTSQIK